MKFRPCIDIHNGTVKQIVGGSLKDQGDQAVTNFSSGYDAAYYAKMYKEDGLTGGHVIMLNSRGSQYFEETKKQALNALKTYPMGLQIGGGITADNAYEFLDAGASHVIVTSYVFSDGKINRDHLEKLVSNLGKDKIVLDLSCRQRDGRYFVVTDRWQKFTNTELNDECLKDLGRYCDEFLIHGVDVEGKTAGIEDRLVEMLAREVICPVTYAGGIGSREDLEHFRQISGERIDYTIGSALDLFGGTISYKQLINE